MSKVLDENAAPSTATEAPEQPLSERLTLATPEEKIAWKRDGIEPPAREKETPAATPEGEAPKVAPESGPDSKQEPKSDDRRRTRQDRKIGELSAENRRLQRELQAARGSSSNAPPPTEPKAQPMQGRPSMPDIRQYDDTEKWQTDVQRWVQGEVMHGVESGIAAKDQQREALEVERTQEERFEEANRTWTEREADFLKTHPKFLDAKKQVSEALNGARFHENDFEVDSAIIDSPRGLEIVDFLSTNPKAFTRILDLAGEPHTRASAIREIGKIEAAIEVSLKNAPKPNTQTKVASRPPVDVGGHDSPNETDTDKAFEKGQISVAEWKRRTNKTELDRLKTG